jgi:hypothetical protein
MIKEKEELENRLSQYESELLMPDALTKSKQSFHTMDKSEFEARLQDVKQCVIPDFGVEDTSLIEAIIGGRAGAKTGNEKGDSNHTDNDSPNGGQGDDGKCAQ